MDQGWVREQTSTTHHKIAIFLFPLVVFWGYLHPVIFGVGLIIFFLVTSFKMLKSMLMWMVVLGVISFVLPFLAPIIFIIMIVLFFMRINYVVKNWRPFVSGLFFYGIAGGLMGRSSYLYSYNGPFSNSALVEGLIVCAISFVALQLLLRWLYRHHYTSYAALGIMGSVPVIIIAFVLPFLKLHVGADFFAPETTVETKPVTGEAYAETKLSTGEPTGTRSSELVHVKEHVRTAPDGDPTNNLSYDGPDKKEPNEELVHVREHVRTPPDGDPTNNLSYDESAERKTYRQVAVSMEPAEEKSPIDKIIENTQAAVPGQTAVDRLISELKKQQEEKERK
ncbi:hypothetical protein GCM10008967_30900 [Bacillus carboniphilus]|uniref:Uncharacterized protein n=1 Tax=Bacillus carboniphilus TaxID=86663 RepID=A0ABN0WI33_9BACI